MARGRQIRASNSRIDRGNRPRAVDRSLAVARRRLDHEDRDHREGGLAWVMLLFAGLLEVVWAYSMKASNGFTRLMPSLVTLAAMLGSFVLLAASMRVLPLGTAYSVWTGIGAIGAFVVGVAALGEPASGARIAAAVLIVTGLLLMKLSSPS